MGNKIETSKIEESENYERESSSSYSEYLPREQLISLILQLF
jgi:hypothetical protein